MACLAWDCQLSGRPGTGEAGTPLLSGGVGNAPERQERMEAALTVRVTCLRNVEQQVCRSQEGSCGRAVPSSLLLFPSHPHPHLPARKACQHYKAQGSGGQRAPGCLNTGCLRTSFESQKSFLLEKNSLSKKHTKKRKGLLPPCLWPLLKSDPQNNSELGKAEDVYLHVLLPVGVGLAFPCASPQL